MLATAYRVFYSITITSTGVYFALLQNQVIPMAKDAELDRLKTAQDLAFQRKQDAHKRMQQAWERRSNARDALNRAHEAKQSTYASQDATWQDCQRVRSYNGPRIEQLNAQQERAFENMKSAFDNASAAHDRRDGASASSYANEGHAYKAESQGYVAERRRLVDEIRSARARHEDSKPAFQRAKDDFSNAKRVFDSAKADHERAQAEFKRTKEVFDAAATAFRTRLEKVKAEGKSRNQDRQALARQAGVPLQYIDKVWVSRKPDGTVNIYFGGFGEPNGPGHGHYAMDRSGKVTYRRDPFDPHGAQNYTDAKDDYSQRISQESVAGEFGFRCRFRGYDAYVESNTNRQGRAKIDIYYGPQGPFGPGHHHAVAYRESPFDFVSDELR